MIRTAESKFLMNAAIVACVLMALMFAIAGADKALWWVGQIVGAAVIALVFKFLAESVGKPIRGMLLLVSIAALIWGCFWLFTGTLAVLVTIAKVIWGILSVRGGSTLG